MPKPRVVGEHEGGPETSAGAKGAVVSTGMGWGWWYRLARHAVLVGLVISLCVHVLGGVAAHLIWIRGGGGTEGGGGGGGGVQMAVMSEGELAALVGGPIDDGLAPSGSPADIGMSEQAVSGVPGDDLVGSAASGGIGIPGAVGGGAGDIGLGNGLGGGTGGGGTSFFGQEAKGDRIAFIVDTSGSMLGDRIATLRSQLASAITEMSETSSFVVISFATTATVMGDKLEWTDATVKNKGWARQQISGLNADGNTEPLPAFERLMKVRPKPEAIFFMTDGQFDETVAVWIAQHNKGPKVRIHCICFEDNSGEARMKQIASDSGGTYTFVPRRNGP